VITRLAESTALAVFCDFDGTFSIQDVGSTLARTYMAEKRARLWEEYERGSFDPWSYNIALLEGFDLPQADLQAFLETIDLDPGAGALIDWCNERGAPFRILSDGFDYNLDRLQAIHDVQFDYAANHLVYRDDVWHISPGSPNPDCGCGTGTCKRGIIDARRAEQPGCFCVHVGNGRVSDLCGALAADLAFAKDTLAEALQEQGASFKPFDSLNDVVSTLEGLRDTAGSAGRA
jgi:2-hydroxy-3-keto-5-methylthiopentenyl-1-phosphate phosphatase